MNSLPKALDLAERVELLAARQYEFLAEHFSDDSEASSLFKNLYEEELQHVERIRFLRRTFVLNRGTTRGIEPNTEEIKAVLAKGEGIFEMLK